MEDLEHSADKVREDRNTAGFKVEATDSKEQETSETGDDKDTNGMSKRQFKRMLKRQGWLEKKAERRAKEKEKKKAKRKAMIEEFGEVRGSTGQLRKRLKACTMEKSTCKVTVVVDMSFDHLMHQRDLGKCCKQLLHCYSINRRLENPMQFHVTGLTGRGSEEMNKHEGFRNWDCHFHESGYEDVFDKDRIVYLSSESNNVLRTLEDDKVYVIGGLVDHNNHKGLCHRLALEKNMSHARLPIDEFLKLKTRKVLTIDHVFQIMASVTSGKSWKEAFLETLPARKGAEDKEETRSENDDSSSERSFQDRLNDPEVKKGY